VITSNDIVFADDDGIAFVPADRVDEVLDAARTIWHVEREQASRIAAGETLRAQTSFDFAHTQRRKGDPMDNYDIRYDDKYGQLTHIDLAAEGAAHEPWFNQTLTTVNDCVVRLAVIDGRLVDWHKHEHEDEFFLVLEGRLELEVEGREPLVLGPRHGVTIPRGIVHRPHALGRTVVLMVEPATVVPTGND
jgi:mannose-6-phosphate isomerase-like protein (cupin superfamily)